MSHWSESKKVATEDSTNNNTVNDVIGNKNDTSLSGPGHDSLYGIAAFMGYYHVHSPALIYPRDADPVTLTAVTGATTWSEGTKVEVIAKNAKTEAFDIHFVILGEISSRGNYVVKLYSGDSGSEVFWGECAFTRDTNQVRGSQLPIQGPPVPAGTRISASLLSGADDGETVDIKLYTHEYPA
jgi:hypothetical protein